MYLNVEHKNIKDVLVVITTYMIKRVINFYNIRFILE